MNTRKCRNKAFSGDQQKQLTGKTILAKGQGTHIKTDDGHRTKKMGHKGKTER